MKTILTTATLCAAAFVCFIALAACGGETKPDERPAPERWGERCYRQTSLARRDCLNECDKRYSGAERTQCADGVIGA